MNVYVITYLLPLAFSVALTPLLIILARRLGCIAYPAPRGWHQKPTPLLGGVSFFLSFFMGLVVSGQLTSQFYPLMAGSALALILGLIDDFFHLRPLSKFLGQLGIAILLFYHHPIVIPFIILLMNSFNLLDNIDGLATGVSCLIALGLAALGAFFHQNEIVLPSLALCGATSGFLIYNFHPAKIFMGDAGSLFLGFCLASQSSILLVPSVRHILALIFFLSVPLADTLFVIYSRAKRGTSIVHGGQDHLSHGLLSLGLSPRQAVLTLYLVTFLSSVIGLWFFQIPKG